MDDKQIIALYWQRNDNAIAETDKKYGTYCLSVANNILGNREDSEECVNDTWLHAWNSMPPQKPASLKLFLARITRNLSINLYNAKKAKKRGGGEMTVLLDELSLCASAGGDVSREFEAKELERCINRFVRSLPKRECNIFVRRYFFAEPVSEIAKQYGMTDNHVSVALSRARQKLKKALEKEDFI